ncbi:MAG: hypothetical protein LBS52_04110 [Dysgonamonadaceae bacterium]|nr:hypothetical protein [Dysgonamonadaceae bacterium]
MPTVFILMSACSDSDEPSTFFALKNADGSAVASSLLIDVTGGAKTLTVNSNTSWTAQSLAEWLTVTPSSGKNNGSIRINASENIGIQSRKGQITVSPVNASPHTITVEQTGEGARLSVTPSATEISAYGGEITISVNANATWTYSNTGSDWLQETAKTDNSLTLNVSTSATTERSADLTFQLPQHEGKAITIKITQKANTLVADMLDVVFNRDGTASDISPMHNNIATYPDAPLFTFYLDNYQRYGAGFNHTPAASISAGYYKMDYASNQTFKNKLADGYSLEAVVMFDDVMPQNKEIKLLSSMESGGTGLMISSDNELTFLTNISPSGTSSWQWAKSGVTPERGKYYHLVGVWDKNAGKTYVYINGEVKRTTSVSGNFNFPNAIDKYWFGIGADAGSTAQSAWHGNIVIARIYDDPLNAADVAGLWKKVENLPAVNSIVLDNISYLSDLEVLKNGSFSVYATGFQNGDKILLTSLKDGGKSFTCDGIASGSALKITLPNDFVSDKYLVTIVRGTVQCPIGFAKMEIVDKLPVINTKVIAHRGYWDISGSAQNSIKSLEEAQKLNVYGSEFDVWITTDGRVMLNHDASYGGVTIQTSTYAQVKDLKLSNGEKMPTLEDYLEQGKKSSTKLILEIKTHSTRERNDAVTAECVRLVQAANMTDNVEYIAFDLENCKKVLQLQPNAIVAYLNGDKTPAQLHELGIKGIDYTYSILANSHPEWVKQAHDLGMTVNIWTVNAESDLNKSIQLGVDYITTDNPVKAKQLTER